MSTLPSDATPKTDQQGQEEANPSKKVHKAIKKEVETCKQYRRKLVANWIVSIDYRRGKPFSSQTDEDRIAVNLDWALTKAKHASLFSQVPSVRVSHPPQTSTAPWVHGFETKLNDTLIQAGIENAMEELMPDCINAAGIGVAVIAREAITTEVQVPAMDLGMLPPQIQAQIMQTGMLPNGMPVPMTTVPKTVDQRYLISRVSPADFLWPINFTGSNFDDAPWIGRTGRISWAEAQKKWNLKEEEKNKVVGEDRSIVDRLTHDIEKDKVVGDNMVSFEEIFYKEFQWDPAAQSFSTIHHLVFVHGKDEPVVDTSWEGQQQDQQSGNLIGAMRYPIQVLTLAYLSDEAIPPSDSAIGRPQVNEINKSRTQMILQRERSLPIRWFDVNRIDPMIQQSLMRGTWGGMIPVQGRGDAVVGEVTRASYPPENFAFDKIVKSDLTELWVIGEAASAANVETKGEAQFLQANRQTNVAKERARVSKFYCRVAEVLGGLLCLFEDPSILGEGFDPAISRALSYSILADSTLLLDSNQRLQRALDFYNFTMKTGWVNPEPVLKEIATLSGFDPAQVIRAPEPKTPQEPNISLRLTGTEDMMNPLTLAFLMKSGQAPSTDLIEQAKQLIQAAVIPPPNAVPTPPPPPQMGPDGQLLPPDPSAQPGGPVPVPTPIAPAVPVNPPPAGPPPIGQAHPDLSAMDRVNKRVIERE
jgi:hypothetical protein